MKFERDANDRLFMIFFKKVQAEAMRQHGKVFLCDTSEGNDYVGPDADCSDLSGWLVRPEDAERYDRALKSGSEWIEGDGVDFVVAQWSGDPKNPDITFEPVQVYFD